jgi:hypothetical protein
MSTTVDGTLPARRLRWVYPPPTYEAGTYPLLIPQIFGSMPVQTWAPLTPAHCPNPTVATSSGVSSRAEIPSYPTSCPRPAVGERPAPPWSACGRRPIAWTYSTNYTTAFTLDTVNWDTAHAYNSTGHFVQAANSDISSLRPPMR